MTEYDEAIKFFKAALILVQKRDGRIQVELSKNAIYTLLDALRIARNRRKRDRASKWPANERGVKGGAP